MSALLRDDFDRPDGALGLALTGQSWIATGGATIIGNALSLPANSIATIDTGSTAYTVCCWPVSSFPNAQQNCRLRFAVKDDRNWAQFYNLNGAWCYGEMVDGVQQGFVKFARSTRWSAGCRSSSPSARRGGPRT